MAKAEMSLIYYIKLLSLTNFIISLVCECHK